MSSPRATDVMRRRSTHVAQVHRHRNVAATGVVPDDRTIVVEHFRDETGSVRVVIHAAFGGRVNAPWAMALAHRARESLDGVDVQVQTTDDGIMLRMPDLGIAAAGSSRCIGLSALRKLNNS